MIAESFKVTEALETIGPGTNAPESVTSKPELVWADDSSEDWYDVRVFDAFGNEVWNALELPGVSGSPAVSVQYDGPLEPGMYYQFRVSPGDGPARARPPPLPPPKTCAACSSSPRSEPRLSLDFGLTPEGRVETEADLEAEFALGARRHSSANASTTGAKAAERREGSAFPDEEPEI